MKKFRILAINPGSTSTKVGIFEGGEMLREIKLSHSAQELAPYATVAAQFAFRKDIILEAVKSAGIDIASLDAVIGRGGLVKPISSGIYEVNEAMKHDLAESRFGEHASNLGGLIAAEIAERIGVKAYIADPVVVDELQDVARISGSPLMLRLSIFHALNQKAIARKYAADNGAHYESLNLIIAHLGGGISVAAHRKGMVVDVNNCLNGEGPIAPERAGTLPAAQLARLCFGGEHSEAQVLKMITGGGGLVALLGTNDVREVIARTADGDQTAQLVLDAMCYSVGKSIGAAATVLCGNVDAVILTGGIAHNKCVCDYVENMVSFIAPVTVIPGENELEALASNAMMVLEGRTQPKVYC